MNTRVERESVCVCERLGLEIEVKGQERKWGPKVTHKNALG